MPAKGIKNCSLFAIYDGHGGSDCCNYLKDRLHAALLTNFDPANYQAALKKACLDLDDEFLRRAKFELKGDTSGSCALLLIVVGRFELRQMIS